ncbi:MAG TPA: CDP-glycerol glycerophosphotransferase family protein [Vicinamibacterales bacterium]|nr:CDP-glycerol glycerophosphotransferase family protein [Vicinamibacterales bacterium]
MKVTLLHDTIFRRTRNAITSSLHAADDLLSRMRRPSRRILFEAASPLSLAVFRPVMERLQRDPRIEFWFTTADSSWNADRTFGRAGITDRIVTPGDVRWMKFDAYVNTDFWNTTWVTRKCARIHLFHGVAGKYGLDAPVHIAPVIRSFDRLMFANEDRLRRYVEAGLVEGDGDRAQLIGYPKADCLVDGSLNRCEISGALGLDPSKPTVLYAPTWSAFSSLNSIGASLLPALASLGVNIVAKLHDRSFDPRSQSADSIDWRRDFEAMCRLWGVHAAVNSDIARYLYVADALITDHSSAGFEYMLLDRPIVVIDCPELIQNARVAPDKVRLLQDAAIVARHDAGAIASAVERALGDPTAKRAERLAGARRVFHRPGTATARAVECIYGALELDPYPVAASQAVSAPAVLSSSRTTHHV